MSAQPVPAELTYVVPGMSCSHCGAAISDEVAQIPGGAAVHVDFETRRVTMRGARLGEAGYDAEP